MSKIMFCSCLRKLLFYKSFLKLNFISTKFIPCYTFGLFPPFLTIAKSAAMNICVYVFESIQFSFSVVSDCLRARGLQHSRLPCL